MDHALHGLHHRNGGVTLEDVAAHIDTARALRDGVGAHLQRVEFWQLLATGDDDRHRAARGHGVEFGVGVVALHHVRSEFGHDAGGEAEILRRAGHRTTHGCHAHDGDAVAAGGIDEIGEVFEALTLVSAADEDLHGKHAGVEADGFFNVERGAFVGERFKAGAAEFGLLAVDLAFPFFHRADH